MNNLPLYLAAPTVLPYPPYNIYINHKNHSVMAVNQKAIGCKLEIRVLEKLEDYCAKHNLKKNAVINLAIEYCIDHGKV